MRTKRSAESSISFASTLAIALVMSSFPVHAAQTPTAMLRAKKSKKRGKKKKRKSPAVTPAKAAAKRAVVEERVAPLVSAGDLSSAGVEYDNAAAEQGDPVLYLSAGDAYFNAAEQQRDIVLAEAAAERAHIALDILHFHLDTSADKRFRLVQASEVPALIQRAQELIEACDILVAEINAEADRDDEAPEVAQASQPPERDGKAAKAAGIALVSGGAIALGLGAVGLGLGARHQNTASSAAVYGSEYDDVAAKGKRANLLAFVGLPVGAVLAGTGVALLVISAKRAKAKSDDDKKYSVVPTFDRQGGGMAVIGRF